MPVYFGPGRTSTTRQIVNQKFQNGTKPDCLCAPLSNTKLTNSFTQTQTQNQRISSIINYSSGGRLQFGNVITGIASSTFLGRTEGQPGGIIGPLRNKF